MCYVLLIFSSSPGSSPTLYLTLESESSTCYFLEHSFVAIPSLWSINQRHNRHYQKREVDQFSSWWDFTSVDLNLSEIVCFCPTRGSSSPYILTSSNPLNFRTIRSVYICSSDSSKSSLCLSLRTSPPQPDWRHSDKFHMKQMKSWSKLHVLLTLVDLHWPMLKWTFRNA